MLILFAFMNSIDAFSCYSMKKISIWKKFIQFRLFIDLNCRIFSHFPKMHSSRKKCMIYGCGKLVYNIIGQASNRERISGYCKAFLDWISYLMPSLLSLNSSLQREESNDDMYSGQRLIIIESVSSHLSQYVQADRVKSITSAIMRCVCFMAASSSRPFRAPERHEEERRRRE